jgi:type IV pilus assembly protein PilA
MLRSRLRADDGFTLVEILVVILIIGVLAAIALPTFLNQRSKAQDAEAKTTVTAAATAMAVWEQDHGSFAGATDGALAKIEESLGQARGLTVESTLGTYTVTVSSQAGGTYSITRAADGGITRTCSLPGVGGCRDSADANGNSW